MLQAASGCARKACTTDAFHAAHSKPRANYAAHSNAPPLPLSDSAPLLSGHHAGASWRTQPLGALCTCLRECVLCVSCACRVRVRVRVGVCECACVCDFVCMM